MQVSRTYFSIIREMKTKHIFFIMLVQLCDDPGHKLGSVVVRELCPLLSGLVCIGASLRHTQVEAFLLWYGTGQCCGYGRLLSGSGSDIEVRIFKKLGNLK